MRTIDDIVSDLQGIVDSADGRSFTDDEVSRYENLERELGTVRTATEIRARQDAYTTPVGTGHVHVGVPTVDDGLERAFVAYLRTGVPNADIAGLAVTNAQGEGTGAAGGYTVPAGFRQKLTEVRKKFGGFAEQAEQLTTDSGQPLEWPSIDDTANQGTITPEHAAFTGGADLVFGSVSLGAYKYTSAGASDLPLRVSVELLQDSAFDVESLVARKLGERIHRKQAVHWVTGTGVGEPKGVVAASLTSDMDLTTPDTVSYGDLVNFQDLLDEEYDGNAKWVMRRNTWSQIRRLVDTAGRPLVQASTEGIAGRPERRLLDREVVIDEAMPILSSAGDTYPIAYGDFREAYVIRRVSNLSVVVNPYSRAANGEVEFTAWERADGTVQNRTAYKILQNNT